MLPEIPLAEIKKSKVLYFIYKGSESPTIFLPNYGEFGSTIFKLIKMVYFFNCPKKIVCCKKGEEVYFPNADEFCYDWTDCIEDEYKWGFFTKRKLTGIGENKKYKQHKEIISEDFIRIKNKFGENFNYVHLWNFNVDNNFYNHYHKFIFQLKPKIKYDIKTDIVISPRNRKSREVNNFKRWDKIIKKLNTKGYTVGSIGIKEQSFILKNSVINSWDYKSNSSAIVELLSNCKLYIGLDTGPSHLAAFMSIPMIVFSHANQKYYFTKYMKEINKNYFEDLGSNVQDFSMIIERALSFLENK